MLASASHSSKGASQRYRCGQATAQLSGTFATYYLATEVGAKLLASLVMGSAWGGAGAEHTVFALFTLLAGLSAMSLLWISPLQPQQAAADLNLVAVGPEPEPGAAAAEPSELRGVGVGGSRKANSAVQLMRRDPKLLLMAPTQLAFGFAAAEQNGWVNGVAVTQGIGGQNIGYLIALSTAVAALASALFSSYTKGRGKRGPMLLGAAAYTLFGLALMVLPLADLGQWNCLIAVYSIQGIGRGSFESTNKAVLADYFGGAQAEAAFASFVIFSGLSMAMGYAALPHIPREVSASLCVLSAAAGGVCYLVAERLDGRERDGAALLRRDGAVS